MWRAIFFLLVALMFAASLQAQSLPANDESFVILDGDADWLTNAVQPVPDRIWVQGEYLLWQLKKSPVPLPLVTTGDPNVGFPTVNSAGAIGRPGTQVLFGDEGVGYGGFSGMRLTVGMWADDEGVVGVEGSGFVLERRADRFSAASDSLGNPPLYIPVFNAVVRAERAVVVSDPLRQFSGDVSVSSSLQLWGAEFNGLVTVVRDPAMELSLIGGIRTANLSEDLRLRNSTDDLIFINTTVLNDNFETRNQFYGGQFGARGRFRYESLCLDLTGKLALGATRGEVNTSGSITQFGPGAFAPGTFPGGLLTQPTNIGRRGHTSFSVIPAVELKLAYELTRRIRASVGYDFMCWSDVVRPGDQIDRNINPSQSPILGGGALVGPASPAPLFDRSGFFAHGVSFGAELRF